MAYSEALGGCRKHSFVVHVYGEQTIPPRDCGKTTDGTSTSSQIEDEFPAGDGICCANTRCIYNVDYNPRK